MNTPVNCFGFYQGGRECNACAAQRRCRSILVTDGFDIISQLIGELSEGLDPTKKYQDVGRPSVLVDQLLGHDQPQLDDEQLQALEMLKAQQAAMPTTDLDI